MFIVKVAKAKTELPNQERVRTLGEKKDYGHLGILKEITIKQAEIN